MYEQQDDKVGHNLEKFWTSPLKFISVKSNHIYM